jgi:hypothetical protein
LCWTRTTVPTVKVIGRAVVEGAEVENVVVMAVATREDWHERMVLATGGIACHMTDRS